MTALLWLDQINAGAFLLVAFIVITCAVIVGNLLVHWVLTPRRKPLMDDDDHGLEVLEPRPGRRPGSTWNDVE
jgi:hypothetical protein